MMLVRSRAVFLLWIFCCGTLSVRVAESAPSQNSPVSPQTTHAAPHFNVRAYVVEGSPLLPTNTLAHLFSPYTGTDISLDAILKAASALQMEYHNQGCPAMSVAFVPEQITGGIVTFNVARTAIPQIMVAGERYLSFSNGVEIVSRPPAATSVTATNAVPTGAANGVPPATHLAARPATHEEMAGAMAALHLKMAELEIQAKDPRVHVVSTNAGPRFEVKKYLVNGNTILPPTTIGRAITNIDGAFGTNVSFDGIQTVVGELGKAYRERGYVTVAVGLPQQKLTNATVKVQVTEGRLAAINVAGNHYFSSNNVMRSLPSLHTNMFLNGLIFQAELNRANASQDRQIYPVIGPGPEPDTSELTLNVKDRLPFHAKMELNNQSSPGTSDLRVNSSAVYDNLWQLEHSFGVQYGFSPETYKQGSQWDFYDQPSVANYSAFYRLPLGNPEPVENMIASNPGSFGYSEATRKFNLPPVSGRSELTFFASRAAIDTGLTTLSSTNLYNIQGNSLDESVIHEDLTEDNDVGFRLSIPLKASADSHSVLSGGLDYKTYKLASSETNVFALTSAEVDNNTTPPTTNIVHSINYSPVPFTVKNLEYLPLSLRYDASWRNSLGTATLGLGLSANLWYSSLNSKTSTDTNNVTTITYLHGVQSLQQITGSTQSSGHWVVINPSFSQDLMIYPDWVTSIRADGQWASEPLISSEQFGAGGVNSVRGYHEGEVFGDTGWHLSLEQQTPPHTVGMVSDNNPLTLRGSVYMDYARVYLLDSPQGRSSSTQLWGAGFGAVASAGSHWQAQFLFSWPLLNTITTPKYQPFFNFALTAQF
jgi:hemolysin activation/secretion protein